MVAFINAIPNLEIDSSFVGPSRSIFIPSSTKTSAEPDFDVAATEPCFATTYPAAAAMIAEVVEILIV